ncbi:MAG: hydrogenase nickel incorporation protein HypB [bacterium]|nr:hydrogenase nickel incorporation protein HypB [bacterium]
MKIPIIRDVLEESDALARQNLERFNSEGIYVVNMMSSPGAGKTTLLERTISELKSKGLKCAVIEGDITSTIDSEKLAHLNIPIVQANTQPFGGDCHVGSHLVHAALKMLPLHDLNYIFIENIGNLVCPAEFYLGEHIKIVVLSLPEGEDKPVKYPLMFRECKACLLNKMDLLPHLDVDIPLLNKNLVHVNGELTVFPVSAKTGSGFPAWIDWLESRRSNVAKVAIRELEQAN